MTRQPEPLHSGELHSAISHAIVRITAEYTGRGPTRAKTHVDGDWIFVSLVDSLTKGEQRLAETGRGHSVKTTRREYQAAMREDMVAEIERLSGRCVLAFLSDSHIDPDVALEAFLLDGPTEHNGSATV